MSRLTKAQEERLWFLQRWARFPGWSINVRAGRKWEAHIKALVKQGLLERGDGSMETMFRITPAGRAALNQPQPLTTDADGGVMKGLGTSRADLLGEGPDGPFASDSSCQSEKES